MVTTIKNPTTGDVLPQFTMYKYDQLNRLRNMKAFADFSFTNNEWNYSSYDGRYQNDFTYDANGNIETAVANNANGDVIDNQLYNYYKPGNNKQNNCLYSITDIAAITSGKDLPSGQIAFDDVDLLNNNYRYNELGELVYDKQMGIDEITWGNNGKIRTVTHSDASGKYNLKFDYNHTGKRIAKHVYNQNNTLLRSEYYTRDASDNVMAVYRLEVDEQNQEVSFRLKERHIYGSSMLGIDRQEVELIDPVAPSNTQSHIVGLKSYTGSNHLGNVLTTFSDKKLPVDENSDGMIDYYQPHIISSSDYAPFGAQLAERSFFSETYPNSFNDKRDDPELGDWQDYGMRMYSTWQRRFPTPDPIANKYPYLSIYQFASNRTIDGVDMDGKEYSRQVTYNIGTNTFDVYIDVKVKVYVDADVYNNQSAILGPVMNNYGIPSVSANPFYDGYLSEAQNHFENTVRSASSGIINYSGGITYSEQATIRFGLTQAIVRDGFLTVEGMADVGIASAAIVRYNEKLKAYNPFSPQEFAATSTEEILHQGGIKHPSESGNPEDVQLIFSGGDNYQTTPNTTSKIHYNVMLYGFYNVDGVNVNTVRGGNEFRNNITEGQINVIIDNIRSGRVNGEPMNDF